MIYQHDIPPFFHDSIGVCHAGSGSVATQGQMLEEVLQDKAQQAKANMVGSAMGGSQPGPTRLHHPKSSVGFSDVFRMFHDLFTRNGKREQKTMENQHF